MSFVCSVPEIFIRNNNFELMNTPFILSTHPNTFPKLKTTSVRSQIFNKEGDRLVSEAFLISKI